MIERERERVRERERERELLPFLLERFDEGGVLLHLCTGACFRLNETAAEIGEELLSGRSLGEIAKNLAARFEIPFDEARADVIATRAALESARAPEKNEELLSYEANREPHLVLVRGLPVLAIDPKRARVELAEPAPPDAVRDAVDGVLPKLLALRGMLTLHASAIRDPRGVRAFSGPSGAGKTTTARAFAEAGAELVSEDLLVLSLEAGAPKALVSAEKEARAFALTAQRALERNPHASIDFSRLDELARGESCPLDSIWFLDRDAREGAEIKLARLDRPDAMTALMGNVFLASMEPSDWRACFGLLARLARQTGAFRATMPRGLEALYAAISGSGAG